MSLKFVFVSVLLFSGEILVSSAQPVVEAKITGSKCSVGGNCTVMVNNFYSDCVLHNVRFGGVWMDLHACSFWLHAWYRDYRVMCKLPAKQKNGTMSVTLVFGCKKFIVVTGNIPVNGSTSNAISNLNVAFIVFCLLIYYVLILI